MADEDLVQYNMDELDKKCNDEADHWAGEGAKISQMPSEHLEQVKRNDTLCSLVLNRLLYITTHYIDKVKPGRRKVDTYIQVGPPSLIDKFNTYGHCLDKIPNTGRYICTYCNMTFNRGALRGALDDGEFCPMLISIMNNTVAPISRPSLRVVHKHSVYYAGAKVHPSHNLRWHAHYLYCKTCGRYARDKVRLLKQECPGHCGDSGKRYIQWILNKDADAEPPHSLKKYLDKGTEENVL